jgi:peroxiredoxin
MEQKMSIKKNDKAIHFNVVDIYGNRISLDDYKGKKLMLSFYRYATCPLCNLRIHDLIQNYDELKSKGLNILAFFESPKESLIKYVDQRHNPPFPIIPDPERKVYKLYDVRSSFWKWLKGVFSKNMIQALKTGFRIFWTKMEGKKMLVPADFLIDDLTVKHAYYGKDISDHMPMNIVKGFLS